MPTVSRAPRSAGGYAIRRGRAYNAGKAGR